VQAAFEAIGPGAEFRSEEITVPLTGKAGSASQSPYAASFGFSAGMSFPNRGPAKVPSGGRSTPYEVTALLSYSDQAGNPGPLAASVNLETSRSTPRRALNNICPARDSPHPDRLRSRRSTHKPSATPSSALPDRARMSRSLIERRYSVPS
jgi:hypothetical protein